MDEIIKSKVFYLLVVILIGTIATNIFFMFDNQKTLTNIQKQFDEQYFDVEKLGDELHQQISLPLYQKVNSSTLTLDFYEEAYCSNFSEEKMTILKFKKDFSVFVWESSEKKSKLNLSIKPRFTARLIKNFSGLSIRFNEEDSIYFPYNFNINEKGKVESFFITHSRFSLCSS